MFRPFRNPAFVLPSPPPFSHSRVKVLLMPNARVSAISPLSISPSPYVSVRPPSIREVKTHHGYLRRNCIHMFLEPRTPHSTTPFCSSRLFQNAVTAYVREAFPVSKIVQNKTDLMRTYKISWEAEASESVCPPRVRPPV